MAGRLVAGRGRPKAGLIVKSRPFELLLFTTDEAVVRTAVAAGVDGIIVDWERRGKEERQAGADTEINADTPDDLRRVRRATSARVICRINGIGSTTEAEIETAIDAGADEILLPMVRAVREVTAVLDLVGGRCGVGILIETVTAVERAATFTALPLARVYVGLNDLGIERRAANIFTAVSDGTVAQVRQSIRVPFGFGGLTVPEGGRPVPCRLLMAAMARLDCQFSFLRRSFHRDVRGCSMADAVPRIRDAMAEARGRSPEAVERDHEALVRAIDGWALARAASG